MTKTKETGRTAEILYSIVDSPLGRILIAGRGRGVSRVSFLDGTDPEPIVDGWRASRDPFRTAEEQLIAYLHGELQDFDIELDLCGTDFQREVWNTLATIPYGRTATYAEIAAAVGRPTAVRAVGAANGANRVPIFVPCHRVIGSDGRLTGYRGGVEIKRALLRLESRSAAGLRT